MFGIKPMVLAVVGIALFAVAGLAYKTGRSDAALIGERAKAEALAAEQVKYQARLDAANASYQTALVQLTERRQVTSHLLEDLQNVAQNGCAAEPISDAEWRILRQFYSISVEDSLAGA